MVRHFLILASVLGFIGVAAGTFGAHGLEEIIKSNGAAETFAREATPQSKQDATQRLLENFNTGVRYNMYHALALLAVAWISAHTREYRHKSPTVAGWAFVIGVILFSGSLYVMAVTGLRWLGMITPIGGVSFLIGWTMLGFTGLKMNRPVNAGGEPDEDGDDGE
jgi:uncharacterized membrane protein YgdD (TMEM256/DUF423 family)